MRSAKIFLVVSTAWLLTACAPDNDYSDLSGFMDEMDARPAGRIEPLPPIETPRPFKYMASTKRSPFEPPVVLKRVDRKDGPKVTPNFNRIRQFLEQFAIGQLDMVGTLAQGPVVYALIEDAEGGVHRVQSGDFIGTDHGEIQDVGDSSIELIEIVPDGTGGWVERVRTVSLATSEA
jgi:type IV pilus assembly protein PilP